MTNPLFFKKCNLPISSKKEVQTPPHPPPPPLPLVTLVAMAPVKTLENHFPQASIF